MVPVANNTSNMNLQSKNKPTRWTQPFQALVETAHYAITRYFSTSLQ